MYLHLLKNKIPTSALYVWEETCFFPWDRLIQLVADVRVTEGANWGTLLQSVHQTAHLDQVNYFYLFTLFPPDLPYYFILQRKEFNL